MPSLGRRKLTVGGIGVKHPLVKTRILLAGIALLFLLYCFGSAVYFVPLLILVDQYGTFGWVLGALLVVGSIAAVSYHGYRKTLDAYLEEAETVTPEGTPELASTFEFIEEACAERDMNVPAVHVHPSSSVNAFAIGRRQDGHVVIMDGLLATLSEEELHSIVAHEIAHLDNRHCTMLTLINGITTIIVRFWTWVGYTLRAGMYQRRGIVLTPAEKAAIKAETRKRVAYVVAPLGLLQKSISRHREYVADAEAVEMTSPGDVASALASVGESDHDPLEHDVAASLCLVGKTSGFLSRIRSTHPPMEKRIRRVETVYGRDR